MPLTMYKKPIAVSRIVYKNEEVVYLSQWSVRTTTPPDRKSLRQFVVLDEEEIVGRHL